MSKIAILTVFVALMSACDQPEEVLLELEEKHDMVLTKKVGDAPAPVPPFGSEIEEDNVHTEILPSEM